MGTRHNGSMPRAVKRAVTAAVEYGVARAGIAAVRALDHDVIGQAHHPRGAAGYVTAWEMAHRPSNRQRSGWVVWLLGVVQVLRIIGVADDRLAGHHELDAARAPARLFYLYLIYLPRAAAAAGSSPSST